MRDTRYDIITCSKCNGKFQRMDYGCIQHSIVCGYPLPETLDQKCPACKWEIVAGQCAPFCKCAPLTNGLAEQKLKDAIEHLVNAEFQAYAKDRQGDAVGYALAQGILHYALASLLDQSLPVWQHN